RLSADRIRGAMKNVGGGNAARKIAVDVDVIGVQYLFHRHHRRDRDASLVDTFRRDVRMAVDNSRDHKLPGSINYLSLFGGFDRLADFGDFSILDENGTVLDGAVRDGKDGGVLDHNHRGWVRGRGSVGKG